MRLLVSYSPCKLMKVAIIGGGFTGLGCAYYLIEKGITPVIFEAGESCGGLAKGFNPGNWRWNLESFYHHIFTNDREIIKLAAKVSSPMIVKKPVTTSFYHGKELDLDSPMSLIKFSGVSFWARFRMGFGLLLLKMIPNGIFLEKYKAIEFLPKLIGKEGYRVVWEKLLKAKFGPYVHEVNMEYAEYFKSDEAKAKRDAFIELITSTLHDIKESN